MKILRARRSTSGDNVSKDTMVFAPSLDNVSKVEQAGSFFKSLLGGSEKQETLAGLKPAVLNGRMAEQGSGRKKGFSLSDSDGFGLNGSFEGRCGCAGFKGPGPIATPGDVP